MIAKIALTCLCIGGICVIAQSSQSAPVSAKEPPAGRAAALIVAAASSLKSIWPGFSPVDRGFLLVDDAGSYLVGKDPPRSFTPRGPYHYRFGKPAQFNGGIDFDFMLEGLPVLALEATGSTEKIVDMVCHESFHAFQDEKFLRPSVPGLGLGVIQKISPRDAASFEIERQLLDKAIQVQAVERNSIAQALALRIERRSTWPASFQAAEDALETTEGLATYVEARCNNITFNKPPIAHIDFVSQLLRQNLGNAEGSPEERLIRIRSYGTGAALGLVLDRLAADWKVKAQSESLQTLVMDRLAISKDRLKALAVGAKSQYGYEALLSSPSPPWGALVGLDERSFDALRTFRLTIEVPGGVSANWQLGNAVDKGPSGMHRPSEGVLLLPNPLKFRASATGVLVEVSGQPVKMADTQGTTTLTVLLPHSPVVQEPNRDASGISTSGLVLSAPGLSVTIVGRVSVTSGPTFLLLKTSARAIRQ